MTGSQGGANKLPVTIFWKTPSREDYWEGCFSALAIQTAIWGEWSMFQVLLQTSPVISHLFLVTKSADPAAATSRAALS